MEELKEGKICAKIYNQKRSLGFTRRQAVEMTASERGHSIKTTLTYLGQSKCTDIDELPAIDHVGVFQTLSWCDEWDKVTRKFRKVEWINVQG